MEMLVGGNRVVSTEGDSNCVSWGLIISAGLSVILAISWVELNQRPVALTWGKYLVKASLRC